MDRIIIGLVGSLSSGKGTLANHLKDLGFSYQILSDRVREEAVLRGLTISRSTLQDVGNDLRETFGGQILAERTAKLITANTSHLAIDSIRHPDEIIYLKNNFAIHILGIDADRQLRLHRYLGRAKDRGEDGTTIADFERDDRRDFGLGEPTLGQQVGLCLQMAETILPNNGSKEDLFKFCDQYLKEALHFDPEIYHRHKEKL